MTTEPSEGRLGTHLWSGGRFAVHGLWTSSARPAAGARVAHRNARWSTASYTTRWDGQTGSDLPDTSCPQCPPLLLTLQN